jgi:hypothetical protein
MNSAEKAAVLVLLTAFITGCRHKAKTVPPPAAQAPVLPVSQSAKNVPPPQMPPVTLPKVNPPTPAKPAPQQKPKKPPRHKPKPAETNSEEQTAKDQTTAPTSEQAANGAAASDITPIGQLSAAGESTNTSRRQSIVDEINATEKGLNDIKRSLSKEEQETETQARTFLTKAKDALKQEDLDAASTLATRAKVLLDELTKQ